MDATHTAHHGLKYYVDRVNELTPHANSLVKELARVTDGVDPDQGYTKTLLDLSRQMEISGKILAEELKGGAKKDAVAEACVPWDAALVPLITYRRNYQGFL